MRFDPFADDLDPEAAREVLADAVSGADDGELFFERRVSESLVFDDGRLKRVAVPLFHNIRHRVLCWLTLQHGQSRLVMRGVGVEADETVFHRVNTCNAVPDGRQLPTDGIDEEGHPFRR